MAVAFVGPLSRWFARDAGAAGRLRAGVEAWRRDLVAAVAPKVGAQLQWDEGASTAERFDLGDAGWIALRLFAFYAERTDLEMPDTVPPLLELDAEWRGAAEGKFERSAYGQILACGVWLPGDFPVTLRAPLPDGAAAEIGSATVLADQLRWLNQRTFDADTEQVGAWAALPAPAGGELLAAARRGYAGLWAAAQAALRESLPIVVAP